MPTDTNTPSKAMSNADAPRVHEQRVVGHASGWKEYMPQCRCGKPWPCPERTPAPAAQEAFPEELFNGYAVFNALDKRARAHTSSENVADVLDALVRMIRARTTSVGTARAEACQRCANGRLLGKCPDCGVTNLQDWVAGGAVSEADALTDVFASMLGDTYHCTRVWSAWRVGTMGEDDFESAAEGDLPRELANAALQRLRSAERENEQARDAARYRWLRVPTNREMGAQALLDKMDCDTVIDALVSRGEGR